jgi:hypothetical protein
MSKANGENSLNPLHRPVVPDKKLRIFFSRRYVDHERAERLVNKLLSFGGERLLISMLAKETEFNDTAYADINDCDLLLLLITDEPAKWDCSLFDAGYGYAKNLWEKKVVLVHSPTVTLPPPLASIPPDNIFKVDQAKASESREKVEKLLHRIYVDLPANLFALPINDRLFGTDRTYLDTLVDTFLDTAGWFRTDKQLMKEIQITVERRDMDKARETDRDNLPLTTRVSGVQDVLKLFGLPAGKNVCDWQEFYRHLLAKPGWEDGRAQRWVKSLANLMQDVLEDNKDIDSPALPLYGYENTKHKYIEIYRPSIHSAEVYSNGKAIFRIVLTDMPEEIGATPAQDDMVELAHMVDLGRMLHWGVVIRYDDAIKQIELEQNQLKESDKVSRLQSCFADLRNWLLHIKAEAEAKGYNRDRAVRAVRDDNEREVVKETMVFWDKVFGNEEDRLIGKLKKAAEAGKLSDTRLLIELMYDVSKTWLVVCSSALSAQTQGLPGRLRGIEYGTPSAKSKTDYYDGLSGFPVGSQDPKPTSDSIRPKPPKKKSVSIRRRGGHRARK